MPKSVILLLFGLFHATFSQQNQIQCDPNNRPTYEDCASLEYTPVCGYYTDNCPFEVCGTTLSSGCYACQDLQILYYTSGECKSNETVSECYTGMCSFNLLQSKVYEPVCGFTNSSDAKDHSRTFDNSCKACEAKDYYWFQNGACQDDRRYCNEKIKQTDCTSLTSKNSPVCASFKLEEGWSVFTTVHSACEACKDPSVEYYIQGECGTLRQNTTYCLPNNRPGFCTKEYNPVCGFYISEDGQYDHKIASNPCMACADPDVVYHIPGPCVFTCNRNPNVIYECIGSVVEPICGTYTENGQIKKVSLKNSCIGCYNVPILIDSYVDGLCPGDAGIRCENDASGFLQGILSLVCGISQEECNDDSCRQTFSEPLFACNDPSTIFYSPGPCPGDEGISCEPFRLSAEENQENGLWWPWIVYENVCGYEKPACEDDSCRQTYLDQQEACSNESVIFFTQGPCEDGSNEETEFSGETEFIGENEL